MNEELLERELEAYKDHIIEICRKISIIHYKKKALKAK